MLQFTYSWRGVTEFLAGAIMNRVVMNILVHVFSGTYVHNSVGYTPQVESQSHRNVDNPLLCTVPSPREVSDHS